MLSVGVHAGARTYTLKRNAGARDLAGVCVPSFILLQVSLGEVTVSITFWGVLDFYMYNITDGCIIIRAVLGLCELRHCIDWTSSLEKTKPHTSTFQLYVCMTIHAQALRVAYADEIGHVLGMSGAN